ncbi:MAG: hypothetical protein ILNGONEN_01225 [Syntrophorhabdaceae bacterium]|nr:hypothetical protein [Syntrophorhabdaceae bacterium]
MIVTVKINISVGGMIIFFMKRHELLKGQIRNVFRIAAGIDTVRVVGKQRLLRALAQNAVGRRVIAFHFIEDDALENERISGIFQLVMPAFLLQRERRQSRIKHRVEINVDEVVQILQVRARHRITRFVGIGEGIEKRVERAFDQLDKRLFHRKFTRAAEHGMLHNVRNAGGVLRRRAKGDAEGFVLILIFQRQQLRAGFKMTKEPGLGFKLGQFLLADQFESVNGHGILNFYKRNFVGIKNCGFS